MKLCVYDRGNQGSVEGEEASVVLGTGGKNERALGNDAAVVLGLKGVLVELPASVVPVAAEELAVETELAFFCCQPEARSWSTFYRDSEYTGGRCCGEKLELLSGIFVRN